MGFLRRPHHPAGIRPCHLQCRQRARLKWGHLLHADGNLTSDGSSTYTWNARGQLTGITGQVNASYTYDPFGRRQQSTIGGTTTTYLYDGANVAQELAGGSPTVNYLLGPKLGQRYARTDASGTQSYLRDALSSVIALASDAGSIQTTYTYDPFGVASANGAASNNPYQYTGQATDATGIMYDLAWYYNPSTGVFISQDPLGFVMPQANLYQYAYINPVNFTDPTGMAAVKDIQAWYQNPVTAYGIIGAWVIGSVEAAIVAMDARQIAEAGVAAWLAGGALVASGAVVAGGILTVAFVVGLLALWLWEHSHQPQCPPGPSPPAPTP